ncbi:MAG: hypothetical protein JW951_01160 [Lentisphaerae bacterium]|nr:hypothetical protein [Lentisphaerota bacterium]
MKMKLTMWVAAAFLVAGSRAAIIGLNITDGWPTPMLSGGETADGFSNWTDSMGDMGGGGPNPQLGTNVLSGSSVQAIFHSANTWAAGLEDNSEQQLYRVYLDDGDNGSSLYSGDGIGVSVTISGLSAWLASSGDSSYAIRAYQSSDWDTGGFLPVSVRLGAPVTDLTSLTVLDTFSVTAAGDGGFPTASAGYHLRGYGDSTMSFTADTITLTIPSGPSGGFRGTLAGFKITSIPEPATVGLALFGGLLALRRRRASA